MLILRCAFFKVFDSGHFFFPNSHSQCILVNMSLRPVLAAVLTLFAALPALSQTAVEAILPNGRQIRPAGTWVPLAPYPFAIAVKPDGTEAAVPSIGFPFALNVIAHPDSATPSVRRLPGLDARENDPNIEVHAGLAYSPDGQILYVATGNSGKITLYSTADWHQIATIPLDSTVGGAASTGSFAVSVLVSGDGHTLYVLDQGNWRIVVIDAVEHKVVAAIPTGAYPFGQALSPDGNHLYVTNIGLFEYSTVPGAKKEDELATGLRFPPFGYPSKEAREGAIVEGHEIPGLGPENTDRGSSLWTYDIQEQAQPKLTAKLRLGDPITELKGGQIGGSAPTGVTAGPDAIYVSLAHQDAIAKVSTDGTRVLGQTQLSPFTGEKFEDAQHRSLRGVMPSGLALRDDKLYVAESGIDAVAVLDAQSMQLIEHIPAGWNPSAVALSPDGKTLYIVNTKGKGAGPQRR